MNALAAGHDATVQMIDTSMVRVHQHAACIADSASQLVGRSRGGLTSKLHVVVDANGLPIRRGLTPGEVHDNRLCSESAGGSRNRCCLRIAPMMPTGSGRSSTSRVLGPTFHRSAIAKTQLLHPVSLSSPQSGGTLL